MEATREKIVRLGSCWELVGELEVEEAEVEVSVVDIARGGGGGDGDGGGGEEEREEKGWGFVRGAEIRSYFIGLNMQGVPSIRM